MIKIKWKKVYSSWYVVIIQETLVSSLGIFLKDNSSLW